MSDDAINRLAEELSKRTRARRLTRAAMLDPNDNGGIPFEQLPPEDQENWKLLAEIVLERDSDFPPSGKLRQLCSDWDRYTRTLAHDERWRDDMRRAVVIEMRAEVARLWEQCR